MRFAVLTLRKNRFKPEVMMILTPGGAHV